MTSSLSSLGGTAAATRYTPAEAASDTAPAARAAAAAASSSVAPAQDDAATPEPAAGAASPTPKPPRFPWLSRLSTELASSAPQKPAFPSAPVLGDHVDKQV